MKHKIKIKFQARRNLISLFLIFAIITTLGNYLFDVFKGHSIYSNYNLIAKANRALVDAENLASKLHQAEAMYSNFLLTNNVYYVDSYQTFSISVDNTLDKLDGFAMNNSAYENLLSEIRVNIKTRFSKMNNSIVLLSISEVEKAAREYNYEEKDRTEVINRQISKFQTIVEEQIKDENQNIESKVRIFLIVRLPLVLLILLILSASIWVIRQGKRYRESLYLNLMKQNRKYLMDLGNDTDRIVKEQDVVIEIIKNLKNAIEFIRQIGAGNYSYNFEGLNQDNFEYNKNNLAGELQNMRDILQNALKEDKKRKNEDEKRSWATIGIAKFGDLLQQNSNNIEQLSDVVIKNLVDYLNANQGGIFLLNEDEEPKLDLIASYAYNRKKFLDKQVKLGEGLVGACALEGQRFFMTNLPEGYIEISSMLGESSPRNLLIEPLLLDNKILGVIEIASFNEFENYHLDFIEKITQNIASTILSVRINSRTTVLLKQSQQQAETLSSQEEELRQNLEELEATQEDASRKGSELEALLDVINETLGAIEFDEKGTIVKANYYISNKLKIKHYEIVGKSHKELLELFDVDTEEMEKIWQRLEHGFTINKKGLYQLRDGSKLWTRETYKPIQDNFGKIKKVLAVLIDETENSVNEIKLKETIKKEKNYSTELKLEGDTVKNEVGELSNSLKDREQSEKEKIKTIEQFKDSLLKTKEREVQQKMLFEELQIAENQSKSEIVRISNLKNDLFEKNSSLVKENIKLHKEIEETSKNIKKCKKENVKYSAEKEDQLNNEFLLHTIIDQLPHGIFWKDTTSVYTGCNKVFAEMAGSKSVEDIIEKTDYQMPWLKDADNYREEDIEIIKSGKSIVVEKELLMTEGRKVKVIIQKHPLIDADKTIKGIWGLIEISNKL